VGSIIKQPEFLIEYNKKDITAFLSTSVISLTYTDNEHGKSDDLSIQLEDSKTLWKNGWYPTKGDTLTIQAGYKGEQLYPFGSFQIDEIKFSGPPDVVDIKAVSTPITSALRQHNSKAYENKTLIDIAQEIGKTHGFTIIGTQGFVRVERVTQYQERDLAFLKRIAAQYGYIFKIVDNKLAFYKVEDLEARDSVYVLNRQNIISYDFTDSSTEQYKAVQIDYFSSKKKKVISASVQNEHMKGKKADILKLNVRAESPAQAKAIAKSALKQSHDYQTKGNIKLPGYPVLRSGNCVDVTGFGKLDGKYRIVMSTHSIDRTQGYQTDLAIKKVVNNA